MRIKKIISGGQTGVDQGALLAAIDLGIEHGGYCPKGRRCESGKIPDIFNLQELDTYDYAARTEKNILESDGTLLITKYLCGNQTPGSRLTKKLCAAHGKPILHTSGLLASPSEIIKFIKEHKIQVLNVAGTRGSKWEGAEKFTRDLIKSVINFEEVI
jgi:hypothetical protein